MYKAVLEEIVTHTHLDDLDAPEWKNLFEHVSQDVLNDAFTHTESLIEMFKPLKLEPRKCKKYERVIKKKTENKKYNKDFKINSDFLAFRIKVSEPHNIHAIIDKISQIIVSNNGFWHLRTQIHNEQKEPENIIQFIYGYIPEIGYIMEFQVGHPFSMYVFSVDSKMRDNENAPIENFWKNDFYSEMKRSILRSEYCEINGYVNGMYGGHTREDMPEEIFNILCPYIYHNADHYY